MSTNFFEYKVFDNPGLEEPFSQHPNCTFVYDRKPHQSSPNVTLCDSNSFKVLSWLDSFTAEIVVFQIKKFSADMANAFFRNKYKKAYIFTDDKDFKDLFKKTAALSIVYSPPFTVMALQKFRSWIGGEVTPLYEMYVDSVRFLSLVMFKIDTIRKLVVSPLYSGACLTILARNEVVCECLGLPSAREVTNRAEIVCFVFDHDETFPYSEFKQCVFFESISAIDTSATIQPTVEEFDQSKNMISFFNKEYIDALEKLGLESIFNTENVCRERTLNVEEYVFRNTAGDPSRYQHMNDEEVLVGTARFPLSSSRQILEHILGTIRTTLEASYLYIRSIIPTIQFSVGGETNKEFCATISVPGLFQFECTGDYRITKKDAINTACCRVMEHLIYNKVFTEKLQVVEDVLFKLPTVKSLFLKAYGTDNLAEIVKIRDFFLKSNSEGCNRSKVVEQNGKIHIVGNCSADNAMDNFKRSRMLDLQVPEQKKVVDCSILGKDTPAKILDKLYRKVPDCLRKSTNCMALYVFSNSETGILCSESFINECTLTNEFHMDVTVKYKGTDIYTEDELELLKFYQTVFFKMHGEIFPATKQTIKLYYFVAPLTRQGSIDWEYLEQIYNNFLLDFAYNRPGNETLIWNPFTKEFLVYLDKASYDLSDVVDGVTLLSYFEAKYKVTLSIREGKMAFKACLAEQLSSAVRRLFKNKQYEPSIDESQLLNSNADSHTQHIDQKSTNEHLEQLNIDTAVVFPGECCFTTPLKKSIFHEVEIFKRNYRLIEDLFIAKEICEKFNLEIPIKSVVACFTQACETPIENYERLEFLGDCVLKFLATNYLYISGISMDFVVGIKDSIICNQNLFKLCIESGIYRYLRISRHTPRMVQAPCVMGVDNLIDYFNSTGIFKSDNYTHGMSVDDLKSEEVKHYADMIEAMIGVIYLNRGIMDALTFIYKLRILTPLSTDPQKGDLNSITHQLIDSHGKSVTVTSKNRSFNRILDPCSVFSGCQSVSFEFSGLLTPIEITAVEGVIGYKYVNPGNLERALVHPSFSDRFSSYDFQYLELIGDCSLDLFVTGILYEDQSLNTPLLLHTSKKSWVNNSALFDVFSKMGLFRYAKMLIATGVRSKAYSDVVEALIGSILVDLEWNLEMFTEVMNRKIRKMLEECKCELDFS